MFARPRTRTESFAVRSPARARRFWAADPAHVDRIAAVVETAGGREINGPRRMPYGPDYYAAHVCDPCGNRFGVYHRLAG